MLIFSCLKKLSLLITCFTENELCKTRQISALLCEYFVKNSSTNWYSQNFTKAEHFSKSDGPIQTFNKCSNFSKTKTLLSSIMGLQKFKSGQTLISKLCTSHQISVKMSTFQRVKDEWKLLFKQEKNGGELCSESLFKISQTLQALTTTFSCTIFGTFPNISADFCQKSPEIFWTMRLDR